MCVLRNNGFVTDDVDVRSGVCWDIKLLVVVSPRHNNRMTLSPHYSSHYANSLLLAANLDAVGALKKELLPSFIPPFNEDCLRSSQLDILVRFGYDLQ